jgi:PmbA protein
MTDIAATPSSSSTLPDQAELESLVADILAEAKARGASAAETAVNFGTALSVTVRLGEVETLEHHRSRGLGVTVYFGQRKGSASTSDWRPAAVRETVAAACDIARHTAADPCAGLADRERLAQTIADLDLYHPWPVSAEQAIEMAHTCEAAARQYDSRIANSEGASVASQSGCAVYGNSHGFLGGYPSTRHVISCSVLAQDDKEMQRDHWYTIARQHTALESPEAVGLETATRALKRLYAQRIDTRQTPVLFVPEMARGLVGHFVSAIRGSTLYRNASFLVDHLGKRIFPEFLTIREQPHLLRGLGSAPFDGEGVATQDRDLVRDGTLEGYVLGSYSARRLGMTTTGNAGGVHNLIVEPGSADFADLLKRMERGLVVTHLMGQGINLVTGDYSRGASGFWVEGGEIQYPVEEITIAGNLANMFLNIAAVGNDVDTRGNIRCGSVLVEQMTVAGQ